MGLLYIIIIANYLLNINGEIQPYQYSSTIEAFLKGGNELCMGDCMGRKGSEECVYHWNGYKSQCSVLTDADNITPKFTKRYRTVDNQLCYSNCGKFNETYDWCITEINNVHSWNYCSRRIALKGTQTYKTQNEFLTCTDACIKRSEAYNWCHTIKDWQRCDPLKKIVVMDILAESGKECATPCELYERIPFCYDTNGDWKKCYLNPDSSIELSKMSEHMKATRAPGVYTPQGYRRCKKKYRGNAFTRPLSVEDIAKKYEENFPTVRVRNLDNNVTANANSVPAIDERRYDSNIEAEDPVISYTVYNTFSHFSTGQVNLPLVIRAVITNHTLQREFNNEINNQFNEMYPIDDRVNYDTRGHLVPTKLGGLTEIYNIFPQSWRHNRGALSGWWHLESDLYKFINSHPNSYAVYTVVVSYNPSDDKNRPYRPTAVGVRVRLYHGTTKDDDGSNQLTDLNGIPVKPSTNSLENMYFVNDPNLSCTLDGEEVNDNFA